MGMFLLVGSRIGKHNPANSLWLDLLTTCLLSTLVKDIGLNVQILAQMG